MIRVIEVKLGRDGRMIVRQGNRTTILKRTSLEWRAIESVIKTQKHSFYNPDGNWTVYMIDSCIYCNTEPDHETE